MSNEKMTLPELVTRQIFKIPDYQRGYAWESKQINDLIQDIDALVDDPQVKYHYTGTIVVYDTKDLINYKREELSVVDIVDGQQRLASIILYLAVILQKLVKLDNDFRDAIPKYLYDRETPRIRLSGTCEDFFLELLKQGGNFIGSKKNVQDTAQKKLLIAAEAFQDHLEKCDATRLEAIFRTMTSRLVFTSYSIAEECEIGMTFELMNSRGKDLTDLELLKNYLMYWAFRNTDAQDTSDRENLTKAINRYWTDVYSHLGKAHASDNQCLRIAWTLFCHHLPKYWHGYDSFKEDAYIPIRDFNKRNKNDTRKFVDRLIQGLAEIAYHYSVIYAPSLNDCSDNELKWLENIHHTGNIANFLPLLVTARIKMKKQEVQHDEYIDILKAIECFAYRVFLWERRRSNAGKSNFYKWGKEFFDGNITSSSLLAYITTLTFYYSQQNVFETQLQQHKDWYAIKNTLKYTLFEYEKILLNKVHQGIAPKIKWEELAKDTTIEHVLPQNPNPDSQWTQDWTADDIVSWKHDIGNLVLTRDNSKYSNFDFIRKRDGKDRCGIGCYSDSDIRQERDIRHYKYWKLDKLKERHSNIANWIKSRWTPISVAKFCDVDVDEKQDNDAVSKE